MKNGLMLVSTEKELNIGDYVQAVAAEQFFNHIDTYIERERLDEYKGEQVKMIMNGWYMHEPKHWPPSDKISPLFVAFHMNSLAKDSLLAPKSIDYLKQHQPIGCRDYQTAELLQEKGVEAYFSGCLTLTLGEKYKTTEKDGKCYFVDPYFVLHKNDLIGIIRNLAVLPFYYPKLKLIAQKMNRKQSLRKMLSLVSFYREYKKIFSEETLLNAEYITQQTSAFHSLYPSHNDKLEYARSLVRNYAKASLVVTSRIHCALPCLAVGTPVIYIEDTQQLESSSCRLRGLRELFNIIEWKQGRLVKTFAHNGLITVSNTIPNKSDYQKYAKQLVETCKSFINRE